MEKINNFQPSSNASNIPRPDRNPTPTINPNYNPPQFDQVPLNPCCNTQRDDIMDLHYLLNSESWPINPPYWNPIEMPRLDLIDNVMFEEPMVDTLPSARVSSQPSPPFQSVLDDILSILLYDRDNSRFNNEMHLSTGPSSSIEIPPPCNEVAVDGTQGKENSADKWRKWSLQEHKLFLIGMEIYGKGEWKKIANNVVITRTYKQVASHAQKYFERKESKKKRASIHDTNVVDRELLSHVRARLGLRP